MCLIQLLSSREANTLSLQREHRHGRTGVVRVCYARETPSGVPISTDNARRNTEFCRHDIFSIADGTLIRCLDRPLTIEVFRTFAEKELERIVSMDASVRSAIESRSTRSITSRRRKLAASRPDKPWRSLLTS